MLASVGFVALPAAAFGTINVLGPLRLHDLGLAAATIGAVWLVGAAGGGALAEVTSDAVPYLVLSALCLLTLAALWRWPSSL